MTTVDFVIELFVRVDDAMTDAHKHPQSKLHPSEIVTLGLLFALKGVGEHAFYRWVDRDLRPLFPALPERTRLFRLLATHQDWADCFLAEPTLLGVIDTYGIELLHPVRERHKTVKPRIATKGKSNHRWIMGAKLGVILDHLGRIVDWTTLNGKDHDNTLHPMIRRYMGQTMILADRGFRHMFSYPPNLKICAKGSWNGRMTVESVFSMLTTVCHIKKVAHRAWAYLKARLSFLVATFNLLTSWYGLPADERGFVKLSIAEFSL